MKLFMLLLGCKPPGRNTEQHDIFFGVGEKLRDLVPDIVASWQGAGKIHIDAWREVSLVDGHNIRIISREQFPSIEKGNKLFFINLGGYRKDEFDEYHYKMIVACQNKTVAIQQAKKTAFYKHTGFQGAESHIDDKYGIDIDDVFEIEEILPPSFKEKYHILLSPATNIEEDEIHLGYFLLDKI